MNLLRSLQFHHMRATHILTGLSGNTSQAVVAASDFSSLSGTRWPFKVLVHGVKGTSNCFTTPHFFCHRFRVTPGCGSLSHSVDDGNVLKKLPAVETVKVKHETDSTAAGTTDILSVKGQLPLTKDVLKLDIDSEKTESRVHLDESKRELLAYVGSELVKAKAVDLYKLIRKMNSEEVLSLVEHSHHVLDKTHLALAMKRLFTLSTRDSQHCDADVIRQDQRFHILCAYVAKKAQYLEPAILNDIVTFLCHFGITSSDSVMRVCLQLMMKQINSLALDQLAVLAHGLSGIAVTKQTQLLQEAIGILCSSRGDQLSMLSVELKIYLLEEFGHKLPYIDDLVESLWDDKRDVRNWQQAVGFFVALAKASARTAGNDHTRMSLRHESLEEWCMDILVRQYIWLSTVDVEALLGALIQLDIYDEELFRVLGNHVLDQSEKLNDRLSVWNLLADADYMHVSLMDTLLTSLKVCDMAQMSVDTQLSLIPFLAEAANYYRGHATDSDQSCSSTVSTCVEELLKTWHLPESVPEDLQLDTSLYITVLHKSPPNVLSTVSRHILDAYTAETSAGSSVYGHSLALAYMTQLNKLVLLANLQNTSDTVQARVSNWASVAGEQPRPKSVLQPALLMACDDVTHGFTTPLGFYADHLLPSKTADKKSTAVLCWYDSHHFWINTGRLKCIPHLYAATLQRLHSYNVLVVNASAWLSLSERERFMYISSTLNKELRGLTVI